MFGTCGMAGNIFHDQTKGYCRQYSEVVPKHRQPIPLQFPPLQRCADLGCTLTKCSCWLRAHLLLPATYYPAPNLPANLPACLPTYVCMQMCYIFYLLNKWTHAIISNIFVTKYLLTICVVPGTVFLKVFPPNKYTSENIVF